MIKEIGDTIKIRSQNDNDKTYKIINSWKLYIRSVKTLKKNTLQKTKI